MNILKSLKNFFNFDENKNEYKENKEEKKQQLKDYEILKKQLKAERKAKVREIEERQKKYKIKFCFLPEEQNQLNIRSYLEYRTKHFKKWNDMRLSEFAKHKNICEGCGRYFEKSGDLQLHEHWIFNDKEYIQKAERLFTVCEECHNIIHINQHKLDKQKFDYLFEKYIEYNNITLSQAKEDLDFALKEREDHKGYKYQLDMSVCKEYFYNQLDFYDYELFDCHDYEFHKFVLNEFNKKKEEIKEEEKTGEEKGKKTKKM